ncbi:hypothetical protein [Cohnella sp. WQ 127256]|uniref:hypothetical protein n=1 Tax=Cohnella sp. WQ 127256 TaxID=2938790 RepID=UPI00211824D1|nr:hypothetical protein [Cohnella sp. WQ 127256]
MIMWNKTAKHQSPSPRPSKFYNRILAMFLVIALVGSTYGGVASAAETVNSIFITPDVQTGKLYVDDNSIILNAYANISGDNVARNITESATWSSTSTSVQVVKGVVKATGAVSSATITARYSDKTDTFYVTSEYAYDDIKLKLESVDAPDKKDVDLGLDLLFTAKAIKGSSPEEDITSTATWTTSNSAIATVTNGTVKLLGTGEVTITVKLKGKSDSITLTAKTPYSSIDIKKDGNSISGPIEMYVGAPDLNLAAIASFKAGGTETATETATWSSSSASVVKIDEKGKLTAVGQGTAVITATKYGVSDSVTVIVRTEYEVLKVTPEKQIYVTLYGTSVELSATAIKGAATPQDVTNLVEWKIADADQAVAIIKKENGKVYAVPKGVGTVQITASYLGISKNVSITVYPTINTVEIEKDSLDVFVDETGTLPDVSGETVAGDKKDIGKYVEWSSDDQRVVKIEDGKWKAIGKGTATLTASMETSPGTSVSDTVYVQVHDKILTLIPSTETISVVIGKEVDFPQVQLIYENGEEAPVTDEIVWKSSTPKLLVKETKMKGLLATTATLTGTYLNHTVKIKVTVEEEFISFLIEPKNVSLTLKKSQSIKVTGTTKSGKKVILGSRIEWKASNEDHVTVKGASVKGLSEGSGNLTATIQEKTLVVPYEVTAKLTKLTASSTTFKSNVGASVSVDLTALYENGKSHDVTSKAVWTTSKSSVATVSDGKISVKGKGSASIKATFGGKTVTVRVTAK